MGLRTDIENWAPLPVSSVHNIFSEIPIRWGIAGGWALDLHLGKQSRNHSDVDIVINREDQLKAYQFLRKEWELYRAEKGKLMPWQEGQFLELTADIWVSRDTESPWAFQLMFFDTKDGDWIYRREPSIRKAEQEIFSTTMKGIPYLRPEIQLLYKGGSEEIREKDFSDFRKVLPVLSTQEKEWLRLSLETQFPKGHEWIKNL